MKKPAAAIVTLTCAMTGLGLSLTVMAAGRGSGAAAPSAPSAPTGPEPVTLATDEILPPEIKTSLGTMPGVKELPERKDLPDVLTMNDGAKVTTPQQWAKRREEMKTILEYYAVGQAPPPPGNVKGTVVRTQDVGDGKYTYRLIHLTFGPGEKLSLDFGLFTPTGGKPVGVVIDQNGPVPYATALPRLPQGPNQGKGQDVFSPSAGAPLPTTAPTPAAVAGGGVGRGGGGNPDSAMTNAVITHGLAYATFNTGDCAEDTTARMPDGTFAFRTTRFYPAYPNYDWGVLRGWAWGVSRVVDYLVTDAAIDKTKIAVTGVSRQGKSALIAGAFDERITLVAPVASSGGGTPAFRFSGFEHGGNEGLSEMVRKYPNWFAPHLHEFFGQAYKLPFDNHWYLALCAPRATVCLEGLSDQNVNKVGLRQSYLGAKPAFELLGVADHLGVNWAMRPHGIVQGDWDGLLAMADKFWDGKKVDNKFDAFPPEAMGASTPKP